MAQKTRIDSLRGRTVRWTFDDGPTAGTTYEHVFNKDGSIGFRGVGKGANGNFTPTRQGAVVDLGDGRFAISYLSDSGFTLTVFLNTQSMEMVGFASNESSWFQQRGRFTLLD